MSHWPLFDEDLEQLNGSTLRLTLAAKGGKELVFSSKDPIGREQLWIFLETKRKIKRFILPKQMLEICHKMEEKCGKENEWLFFILGDVQEATFIGKEICIPEQIISPDDVSVKFHDFPNRPFIMVHKHPYPFINPSGTDTGYFDFAACCGIVIFCGGYVTSLRNAGNEKIPLETVEWI